MHHLNSPEMLAFKVEEFLAPDFNVDHFVSSCKDRMSMGNLREDLETHYKNIQQALIELINQDYADFVSLSSNLVGTDKTLDNLCRPLGQLKEEVESVKRDLSHRLKKIEEKLEERKRIREKKSRLHHLMNVVHSVEKIEKILMQDPKSPDMEIFMTDERNNPGEFLERVAGEFNQLQFHVSQSKGHPIIESIRPRVSLITSKLQESLEMTFQEGIQTKQSHYLMRCLRTYALIDKISYAEELFRHVIVQPFVEETINEDRMNKHGLTAICGKILKFLETDCSLVLELTTEDHQADLLVDNKQEGVKGFDFLVNAIWPEIASGFEEKLPLVFSPGNPDIFIERYRTMMSFLDKFEEFCTSVSNVKTLRSHVSYQSFMTKWSLPVYYQIRFQEIAGKVEQATDYPFEAAKEGPFTTNLVSCCWQGISRCWHKDVFISPLKGRFWKLTLQIVSRMSLCIKSVIDAKQPSGSESSKVVTVENLTLLVSDLFLFKREVSNFFKSTILQRLRKGGPKDLQLYDDALNEACTCLSVDADQVTGSIIGRLVEDGSAHLENAKNVPRLYRRTNKDPPTQASGYVSQSFNPVTSFQSSAGALDADQMKSVFVKAVSEMTSRYLATVDELLTSIKKTEDSLLRLKRQRKTAGGNASPIVGQTSSGEVTDERKIRSQIHLDVLAFSDQVRNLAIEESDIPDLSKLKEIAAAALNDNADSSL